MERNGRKRKKEKEHSYQGTGDGQEKLERRSEKIVKRK